MKRPKYRNKKHNGYDSKKEAKRALDLRVLEKAGEISDLQEQVKFELIPRQDDENGRCIERACTYTADFVYTDKDGKQIVEDVKGYPDQKWPIKRKLMLFFHGIKVKVT